MVLYEINRGKCQGRKIRYLLTVYTFNSNNTNNSNMIFIYGYIGLNNKTTNFSLGLMKNKIVNIKL